MNRAISTVFGGLAVFAATLLAPAPTEGPQDLRSYYPNAALYATHYLSGHNYLPDPALPTLSVLWFEAQDAHDYRMYNSEPASPQARCHWDQLSWRPDGYLRYVKTVDTCTSSLVVTDFSAAPITFLPRSWDGVTPWRLGGSTPVTHSVDGLIRCTGTTTWVAQILGWEQLTPWDHAIHWRTTQLTNWTTGSGDCAAGMVVRWQEDYWLTAALPSPRGPAKGLKHANGGNLDSASGNWDVWMNSWVSLRDEAVRPRPFATPII
jgi:hypothetical protein